MITVDFEKRGSVGLCEFLTLSLKQQIFDGNLAAGKKLPSKRTLAIHLGVSVITVQNAYNQLIAEGYIYSIEKKGFFVAELPSAFSEQRQGHRHKPLCKQIRRVPTTKPIEYFADFSSNSTLSEKFPFNTWARVMRQVLSTNDQKLLHRQNIQGVLELRQAIAKYLLEFRDMDVSEEQIVVAAGTESLYSMLVQFLGRHKLYAVENPGYKKVAKVIEQNGATHTPIPVNTDGIDLKELQKSKAQVVHLSPTHHFPTGVVMPIGKRLQLLNWAKDPRYGERYIVEDDYDSEFRFNGKPLPTLQSKDTFGRVIYLNTFTKTLAPSFRISYMVLPQNLVEPFRQFFSMACCQVSAFEQYTLASFIEQGFYGKHISRMKNYYRTLRNNLIKAILKSRFKNATTIHEEEAGLHFLLRVQTTKTPEELEERLQEQKIRLPQLRNFYYSENSHFLAPSGESIFVVNYSGIKKEQINQIIKRLEKVF
ncbi:MAG: PLP-dependent aminotransferase family protein [Fibrobacteraceae bacterium]|nr:PLP-dependent aminotransferase family protein [Fibrobacteraceae bacterium]